MINLWNSLDRKAESNLDFRDLRKFYNLKDELESADMEWSEAEQILRDFIQNCVEHYCEQSDD